MAINKVPKLFRTPTYPLGVSPTPDYLVPEGHLRRPVNHPDGSGEVAAYRFGGGSKVYSAEGHPKGKSGLAVYEIRD